MGQTRPAAGRALPGCARPVRRSGLNEDAAEMVPSSVEQGCPLPGSNYVTAGRSRSAPNEAGGWCIDQAGGPGQRTGRQEAVPDDCAG
jgi:hypothetical protein